MAKALAEGAATSKLQLISQSVMLASIKSLTNACFRLKPALHLTQSLELPTYIWKQSFVSKGRLK